MVQLAFAHLRKHFGPEAVLVDVSFEMRSGDRIGLVGPNGAGKSTLMKIVAGVEDSDAGKVEIPSGVRVAYLDQQPKFDGARTVWQEASSALDDLRSLPVEMERLAAAIAASSDPAEQRRLGERYEFLQHEIQLHDAYRLEDRIQQVLSGVGMSGSQWEQPVDQLSGGERNRLLLAKILLSEPDVMVLDEPSNHLDIDATEWLEQFLANCRSALLLVSHDRYLLDKVTNRTLELFRGTVDAYPGNYSAYCRQKAERLEVQRRTFEKQQSEIAKMEEFVRRYHYGQRHAQAEDRRKKLERIELVEEPREIQAPPMSFPAASRCGDIVLRAEHLSKSFDRSLFDGLSFDILRGEKWGIVGPNGCGKTTLLNCLLGRLEPDEGRVVLGIGVNVAYFDQRLADLDDESIVVEAIRPRHKEFIEVQRRDLLARFGITGDMAFQKVGSLSGGERNRVSLARVAAMDANLLVLDEPTNHLDLWARSALESAIVEFDGTVLFVSHDRYFLNRVADHLLVSAGNGFRVIDGNYDTYSHLVRQGLAGDARSGLQRGPMRPRPESGETAPARQPAENRSEALEKPARRKRRFPYRKVAELEAEIHDYEQRVAELHASLATPDFLRDGNRIREAMADLDEARQRLKLLYEHWEEAMELN